LFAGRSACFMSRVATSEPHGHVTATATATDTDLDGTPGGTYRVLALVAAAAMAVTAAVLTLGYPVHGDVRYELGTTAVSPVGPAETFTHRPLLYRLVMAVVAAPVNRLTDDVVAFEFGLRVTAVALAAVAALLLWRGLRRPNTAEYAGPVAVAVFVALTLMSPGFTWEPEWLAVVFTVAGVGVALLPGRRWVVGAAGGVLLAVAAATKVVTLPTALIGVVALLVWDRRRVLPAVVGAAVTLFGYMAVVGVVLPIEFRWMLDMQALQSGPASLLGFGWRVVEYAANILVMWPVLALLPAALVGASRRVTLTVVGCLLLAWVPVVVQGNFFAYHAAAFPVIGAAVVTAGLGSGIRWLTVPILASAGWSAWVMALPPAQRSDHLWIWAAVVVLLGACCWLLRWRSVRVPREANARRSADRWFAAALVSVTFVGVALPSSAESITLRGTKDWFWHSEGERRDRMMRVADQVRAVTGPTDSVSYLTYGEWQYFVGNPATCRYVSPVFLQRGRTKKDARQTESWEESLACLTDTPGDWLVRDTRWFPLKRQPKVVLVAIEESFDCSQKVKAGHFEICPRRR
jgi:hypothetical protein